MAQYDIHALVSSRTGRGPRPVSLVVDLQASLFDHLPTRLIAPLIPAVALSAPIARLNPAVVIDSAGYYLLVQQSVGLSTRELGPVIGSAADAADKIKDALDLLLLGI